MKRNVRAWSIALLAGLAFAGEAIALDPARGRLLVATPRLVDSNFSQTVVLLLDYGERGAEGLVINRPSQMRPARLLPEISELADYRGPLFFGGPVQRNGLLVLLRDGDFDDAEIEVVLDGVSVTSDIRLLREAAGSGFGPDALRLYAGRAGWMPGQLEYEIRRKAWVVTQASPALVFSPQPDSLWRELVPAARPINASRAAGGVAPAAARLETGAGLPVAILQSGLPVTWAAASPVGIKFAGPPLAGGQDDGGSRSAMRSLSLRRQQAPPGIRLAAAIFQPYGNHHGP